MSSDEQRDKQFSFQLTKKTKWLWLGLGVLLPAIWLCAIRILFLTTGECSADSFYHVGMAELGPRVFLAKTFPWMGLSAWGEHFADKELLFHMGLWVLHWVRGLVGLSGDAPFHYAMIPLILLICSSFVFAAKRLGVWPPLIAGSALLGFLMSTNFTFRAMMLRPHIVAIALILVMCGILAKGTFRFRLFGVLILSLIFTWGYSNPHFIILPVICFAFFHGLSERSWKWAWLPFTALVGVVAGLVIHPQFPNSLLIWKIQSIDAMFVPMFFHMPIAHPSEMMTPAFKWHLTAIPLYILTYCNLFLLFRLVEKKGIRGVNPNLYAIAAFALTFTAGVFVVIRAVEYAVPFSGLLFGMLLSESLKNGLRIPFHQSGKKMAAVLLGLGIALGSFTTFTCFVLLPITAESKPPDNILLWLNDHVKAGDTIINVAWSDFPILFYYDRGHRFLWGMDPMFSISYRPKQAGLLASCNPLTKQKTPSAKELYREFGIRYGVVLYPRLNMAQYLKRRGWKVVYEGKDGLIFDLGYLH